MTPTLYEHPFASYCWKVLIALYERDVTFERVFVGGAEDRATLANIWPVASIPVLVDPDASLTLPESTTIIEHLDAHGDGAPLIPADPAAALHARLWDRIMDGQVMTPMQKIVADSLRPEGCRDPHGVDEARATLDRAYRLLDAHLGSDGWLAGLDFSLADCAAAPALFYARVVHRWDEDELSDLTGYFSRLTERPTVTRVIEEAREYRPLFPLPWPDYVR
jgi:glutathione S-transferase